MKKLIFTSLIAMVMLNAAGASACVFADDPAACQARQNCKDQGWLKPFCYMGASHQNN